MAFSLKQIQEIESIFQRLDKKNLNWKIVQNIPSVVEKNTLYFLQVSIIPKRFDLYHTDSDGDLSKIFIAVEKVNSADATDLNSAIALVNELKQKFNNL